MLSWGIQTGNVGNQSAPTPFQGGGYAAFANKEPKTAVLNPVSAVGAMFRIVGSIV